MEITVKGKELMEKAEETATDALMAVCRPLLIDGDGYFWCKNGNGLHSDDVLKEHRKMQKALVEIKDMLDAANCQITVTMEIPEG